MKIQETNGRNLKTDEMKFSCAKKFMKVGNRIKSTEITIQKLIYLLYSCTCIFKMYCEMIFY